MSLFGRVVRSAKHVATFVLRHWYERQDAPPPLHPAQWGLDRDRAGALTLDGLSLHALGTEFGLPLHVVNATRLQENATRFLAVPPGASAGCEVFYSYKTNPVPGVLSALHATGIGAEVTSPYELWLAQRLGVPPRSIIVNGAGKSSEFVRAAVAAGVELLHINHREEIALVAETAKALGRKVRVGVRIATGGSWSGQFGMPVAGGFAFAGFEEATRSPHLEVVGLMAHRGGMIDSDDTLTTFAQAVLAFADEVQQRLGLSFEVLDFGGSLGTPTVRHLTPWELRISGILRRGLAPPDPREALGIDRYVATLVRMVEERYRGRRRPRIFLEPGRAMTSDTQLLLGSVQTIKSVGDQVFALMDVGINLAESCRSEYHQIFATRMAGGGSAVYTLAGPICTPADILCRAISLPTLSPGDTLAFMDAGAYFVPFSTSFSFPRPGIVMVDRQQATLLRRAETLEDLVGLDCVSSQEPPADRDQGGTRSGQSRFNKGGYDAVESNHADYAGSSRVRHGGDQHQSAGPLAPDSRRQDDRGAEEGRG